MSTESQLADWKAKTDAATPGEWVFSFAGHDDYEPGLYPQVLKMDNGDTIIELDAGSREVNEASSSFRYDADFIAVSRTAMPKLLAAVESVLAVCDKADDQMGMSPNWMGLIDPDVIREAITDALGGASNDH